MSQRALESNPHTTLPNPTFR